MAIERWIDKEDVIYLYNGILLIHKKEWNNAICNNMDEPEDYYTKWNKTNIICYCLYVESKDTNELTYKQK